MISILRAAPAAALAILIAAPVAAQPPQDDAHKREADLIQRATAALKAKDLNAGRDLLSQASELVPEDATPVFGLIELDLHDKRYDEAAQLADRKLKVVRDAQGMELLLRESFKVQILWAADAATPKEDARKRLNRAIALAVTLDTAPIRVSVVLDASRVLERLGYVDAAVDAFKRGAAAARAKDRDPGFEGALLLRASDVLARASRFAEANTLKDQALALAQEAGKSRANSQRLTGGAIAEDPATPVLVPQTGHADGINFVALHPSGDEMAVASGKDQGPHEVVFWDVHSLRSIRTLGGFSRGVRQVLYSKDGTRLMTRESSIRIWSTASLQPLFQINTDCDDMAVVPGRDMLITAGQSLRLWDIATGQQTAALAADGVYRGPCAVTADGKTLAVASAKGAIEVWDLAARRRTGELSSQGDEINALVFTPAGDTLIAGCGKRFEDKPGHIRCWTIADMRPAAEIGSGARAAVALAISPDGSALAVRHEGITKAEQSLDLWDLKSRRKRQLHGVEHSVDALAFVQGGRVLIAGGGGGGISELKAWDTASGTLLADLGQHARVSSTVAFAPQGDTLAVADRGGSVRLWNLQTARPSVTVTECADNGGSPGRFGHMLAFDPTGERFAGPLKGQYGLTRIWSARTGAAVRTLGVEPREILRQRAHSSAFSADAQWMVNGYTGRIDPKTPSTTVTLWNVATGQQARVWSPAANSIDAVAFTQAGDIIATLSESEQVTLYSAATGATIRSFKGSSFYFGSGLAFSPDGRLLAASGGGSHIDVWNTSSGDLSASFDFPSANQFAVYRVSFNRDGTMLAAGGTDGTVRLWSVATRQPVAVLKGHAGAVAAVTFAPDGVSVISSGADRTVRWWDPKSGRQIRQASIPAQNLAVRADGQAIAAVASPPYGGGGIVTLWDAATNKTRQLPLGGRFEAIASIAFDPTGRQVLVGNAWSLLRIDFESGKVVEGYSRGGGLNSVAWSRDGSRIATAHRNLESFIADGTEGDSIEIWDSDTGGFVRTLHLPKDSADVIEFGADGKTLATIDSKDLQKPSAIRVWSVETGARVAEWEAPPDTRSLAISPDGARIAAASASIFGGQITVWKYPSGERIRSVPLGDAHGIRVAWRPDGGQLVAACSDGAARVFDAETFSLVRTVRGSGDSLFAAAFDPSGRRIATAGADAQARLWDAATGREMVRLIGVDDDQYMAATPAGDYLASMGAYGGVAFRLAGRAYPLEQFDLRYNRPDRVLESMGVAETGLLATYRTAHEKRLELARVSEQQVGGAVDVPDLTLDTRALSLSTPERDARLRVSISDDGHPISRIRVVANGVPATFTAAGRANHGSAGMDISAQSARRWSGEIVVPLAAGVNRLQVSAVNDQGTESLAREAVVSCTAEPHRELYVLSVGISQYAAGDAYRLKSADVDATSVADLFCDSSRAGGYSGPPHRKVLLNDQATHDNIVAAREFLAAAKPDDTVVVFIAGHGLLDGKLDYYFATHDVDFGAPAAKGLSYDAIEGLLDGVDARQKLLMMDTCHAGEVDRSAKPVAAGGSNGRGTRLVNSDRGKESAFDILQEQFFTVEHGSGATVIAASRGIETAAEDRAHGIFTQCLLDGLGGKAAGPDGAVTVTGLNAYVAREVDARTDHRQRPITRRLNLQNDFQLARLPAKK